MLRILLILTLTTGSAYALDDPRFCGEPQRYSDGRIIRSLTVLQQFERIWPLPLDESRDDWQIDHVIPLASGGCDNLINLQWLKRSIKTCAGTECKDRWERRIYDRGLRK